jgi:hypothetical protein
MGKSEGAQGLTVFNVSLCASLDFCAYLWYESIYVSADKKAISSGERIKSAPSKESFR